MPPNPQRNNNSRWVEVTDLARLTGLSDALEDVQSAVDTLNTVIDELVSVLDALKSLIEVADLAVEGAEDIQAIAVNAFIESLTFLKDTLVDNLRDLLEIGLYVFPHFESLDIEKIIRNELLSRGVEETEFAPRDRIIRVPNPNDRGQYHFERVRRNGIEPRPTFDQFIEDTIESLDDEDDIFRPIFDASDKISSIFLIAAADDIAIFLIGYILLSYFNKGPEYANGVAKSLLKILRVAIGQSESLGRDVDTDKKQGVDRLMFSLKKLLAKADLGEDIVILFQELFGFLIPEEEVVNRENEVSIQSVKVTGISNGYTVFSDNQEVLQNNISVANKVNTATIEVKVSGTGTLEAIYDYGNQVIVRETIGNNIGSNRRSFTVDVALKPVGQAVDNFIAPDFTTPLGSFPGGFGLDWVANTNELFFTTNNPNIDPQQRQLSPPLKVTLVFRSATDSETIRLALPKFNKVSPTEFRPTRDGYGHNVTWQISPSRRTVLDDVADFIGITSTEAAGLFPVTTSRESLDLTRFGPGLDRVDVTVEAFPQTSINSTFSGTLIVNGTSYDADETNIGLKSGVFTFRDVEIPDDLFQMFFVSEIEQLVFFTQDSADNGNFLFFSEPERLSVQRVGGILAAPEITSGNRVNANQKNFVSQNAINQLSRAFGNQGIRQQQDDPVTATYSLQGKRAPDAHVYAILKRDGAPVKIVSIPDREETSLFSRSRFGQEIHLDIIKGKPTQYAIDVYQTFENATIREVERQARRQNPNLSNIKHDSRVSTILVTVDKNYAQLEPIPPNWVSFSLDKFFPIANELDILLSDLIEAIEDAVPRGPYSALRDFLDAMEGKINSLIGIFESIAEIINSINALLQLGGTGIWALGIEGANGMEGWKERLRNAPVPDELADAKFVTGSIYLAPGIAGESLISLFESLPSEGTDSVTQRNESLDNIIKQASSKIKQRKETLSNEVKATVDEIDTESIASLSIRMRLVDTESFTEGE